MSDEGLPICLVKMGPLSSSSSWVQHAAVFVVFSLFRYWCSERGLRVCCGPCGALFVCAEKGTVQYTWVCLLVRGEGGGVP